MSTESKAVERTSSNIDGPVEAPHRTDPSQSSLCTRCVGLRLEEALIDIKPPEGSGERLDVKIADVGQFYRDQWTKDCNLCHMLAASRVTVKKSQDHEGTDELHVYNLSDDVPWVERSTYGRRFWQRYGSLCLYLAVVPSGFRRSYYKPVLRVHGDRNGFTAIHRRGTPEPQVYAPQIISPLLDLSLVRYWLHYCKDHHKRLCSLKTKGATELHLIDCRSLEVIPAPDQAIYTALSYVWGVPTATTDPLKSTLLHRANGRRLPSPLPAIIVDAISVTIGLGFHFLWVDRYCIDQDNHSKHQQINQMDSIYQNAEMTIIAAAGSGPEYGLPGINSRSRTRQQMCTVGNLDIFSTMKHPHRTIQSSKWSSRAWTFQEAALSRRNLVFTDDQVYFECNAMNCHESLKGNLDKLHMRDKSQFHGVLQNGLFGRAEYQKYGYFDESTLKSSAYLSRFMGMVEQYTAKDLTYDTDSLNAFSGIMRDLEKRQTALCQIWGVPFCRNKAGKPTQRSFVNGLGWFHKARDRTNDRGPSRRPGFPSWSWAGWAGGVQYQKMSSAGRRRHFSREVKSVYIEVEGGSKVRLSAYIDMVKGVPQESNSPPAIHIKALALPTSAFTYDISTTSPSLQVFGYPARLRLSTEPWDISLFFQSIQDTNQRQCIYLGYLGKMPVIMVLEALDGSWSRVGTITLDGVLPSEFFRLWKEFTTKSTVTRRTVLTRNDIGVKFTSFRVI